jgi:hypothetical protein
VVQRGKLVTVCGALNEHGARYVLAGAQAGILWGHVRATRDIDLLIEPTEENARRVLAALDSVGFVLTRDLDPGQVVTSPVTVIGDRWHVELFTLAWSVRYAEAITEARVFEVEGVEIPALSLRHLIASKRTGRLQDAADIEVLEGLTARF